MFWHIHLPYISNCLIHKEINMAKSVKGSKTEQSLKEAFAGESQANRRYLYFANQADIAGANDVAAVFRHSKMAFFHLDLLQVAPYEPHSPTFARG